MKLNCMIVNDEPLAGKVLTEYIVAVDFLEFSQLAEEFGYSDESHLSHAFKAHFHQSPSSFKRQRKSP